jgi:hypothetical protein
MVPSVARPRAKLDLVLVMIDSVLLGSLWGSLPLPGEPGSASKCPVVGSHCQQMPSHRRRVYPAAETEGVGREWEGELRLLWPGGDRSARQCRRRPAGSIPPVRLISRGFMRSLLRVGHPGAAKRPVSRSKLRIVLDANTSSSYLEVFSEYLRNALRGARETSSCP